MPEESFEERTEAPSPKRRNEAREKGNVAKSAEINSVFVLCAGVLVLRITGPWIFSRFYMSITENFSLITRPILSQSELLALFQKNAVLFMIITLPIVLSVLVCGIAANLFQIGFLLTAQPLIPKFEKINPLSGFKRMFSFRSVVEAVKSMLKMILITFVAYLTIKGEFDAILMLCNNSVGQIWLFILHVAFKIVIRTVLVLLILAIFDYAYQRYEYEKKLKMTRQEVKEERKQMEGDPQIKSRIRSLQREMARRRMMQEVPKATVVVTNPTSRAIAIRYEAEQMQTPQIVAKGKHHLAQKIKEIALQSQIPVIEDKPLARALYDKVEPGDDLPVEFFNAIAEILAYVYTLKNKHRT